VGPRTLTELFFITAGLVLAGLMTWAAAWAYPMGREPIRWCGLAAMVATIAMGAGPLARAIRADRGR
jgi:1,4-dihydroxy-2-naphthoate octaprenyltransferase